LAVPVLLCAVLLALLDPHSLPKRRRRVPVGE
jgi:hypothetical protein